MGCSASTDHCGGKLLEGGRLLDPPAFLDHGGGMSPRSSVCSSADRLHRLHQSVGANEILSGVVGTSPVVQAIAAAAAAAEEARDAVRKDAPSRRPSQDSYYGAFGKGPVVNLPGSKDCGIGLMCGLVGVGSGSPTASGTTKGCAESSAPPCSSTNWSGSLQGSASASSSSSPSVHGSGGLQAASHSLSPQTNLSPMILQYTSRRKMLEDDTASNTETISCRSSLSVANEAMIYQNPQDAARAAAEMLAEAAKRCGTIEELPEEDSPPRVLVVNSDRGYGGRYRLVETIRPNGEPLWRRMLNNGDDAADWIFRGPGGQWFIGDENQQRLNFATDTGNLASKKSHAASKFGGGTPDMIGRGGWLYQDGRKWRSARTVNVHAESDEVESDTESGSDVDQTEFFPSPDVMIISSDKGYGGRYKLVEATRPNGKPLWRRVLNNGEDASDWLFQGPSGQWFVGDGEEHFVTNSGNLGSKVSARGALPDEIPQGGWNYFDGKKWLPAPNVRVFAEVVDPPISLIVTSDKGYGGRYTLVDGGVRPNGQPLWQRVLPHGQNTSDWLFQGPGGRWLIGDEDEERMKFNTDSGNLGSKESKTGVWNLPTEVGAGGWQYYNGHEWEDAANVNIQDEGKVVASSLYVDSDKGYGGTYRLIEGVRPNGEPLWRRMFSNGEDAPDCLFQGPGGQWFIGDEDEEKAGFKTNSGNLSTKAPASGPGASPTEAGKGSWQFYDGRAWHDSPAVQIVEDERSSIPKVLVVQSNSGYGGRYCLVENMVTNNHPIWRRKTKDGQDASDWLFRGPGGRWLVGDEDEERACFSTDTGNIRSKVGLLDGALKPDNVGQGGWQFFDGANWHEEPTIDIYAEGGKGSMNVDFLLDLQAVFTHFERFEGDKRVILTTDLRFVLDSIGHNLSDVELKALTKEVDSDASGTLDFDEFCWMVIKLGGIRKSTDDIGHNASDMTEAQTEALRKLFGYFAKGESETLLTTDLGKVMCAMGQKFSDSQLQELIEQVDEDDSGTLDFEEFLQLVADLKSFVVPQLANLDAEGYKSSKSWTQSKPKTQSFGDTIVGTRKALRAMIKDIDVFQNEAGRRLKINKKSSKKDDNEKEKDRPHSPTKKGRSGK